jgi:eukaryotic-like serine/threonine-protein kinase
MLYEMATGSVPFSGQSPADVMTAILAQHPKPPSRLNTSVPAELDRIILKALEKDPKLRYESAAALKTDLIGIRQGNDSGYYTR